MYLITQLIDLLTALRSLRTLVQVDIATGWTGAETRAVMVETAGLIRVDGALLGAGVYVPVAAGVPIAMAVTKIYSTADGSTVTGRVVAAS